MRFRDLLRIATAAILFNAEVLAVQVGSSAQLAPVKIGYLEDARPCYRDYYPGGRAIVEVHRVEKAAKFIIYRDFEGGYRWRLRSLVGETIVTSVRGYDEKFSCENELESRRLEYPNVPVRDATVRSHEEQLTLDR